MKKAIITFLFLTSFVFIPHRSHAVAWVVVQQAIKKILLEMDAQVQRLQNKTIGLQNAQKKLENNLSKLKLDEISDWAERQRKLYDEYYQEMWKVKNTIAGYNQVRLIIRRQTDLVAEYKKMHQLLKNDKHFTLQEIAYMGEVYDGILKQSIKNIEPLFLVLKSFDLQMSDGARIAIISQAAEQVEENIRDMRKFSNENMILSLHRSNDEHEIRTVRELYGLP